MTTNAALPHPERAVVLLSGGLDSTTVLALAVSKGLQVVALSFDYKQRHRVELEAARAVAKHYDVLRHIIVELGVFREIGGSALTDAIDVPKPASVEAIGVDIPVTYVPARNLVFLSHAVAVAEVVGASSIHIGVNALDYSGYPDCRPEFIEAFQTAATLGTKLGSSGGPLRIEAPLVSLAKRDIVALAARIGAPYHLTQSCYDASPDGRACGKCDSCVLRREGFRGAGVVDPTSYR